MARVNYQHTEHLSTSKGLNITMWFEQFAVFLEVGELVDEPEVPEIPVVNHRPEGETQRLTREREDVRRL